MAGILKERHTQIDVMKAILVAGMIFDHIVFLLTIKAQRLQVRELIIAINMVSFPGFLFCFGYAAQIAYFSDRPNLKRIYISALRILVAYYLSAVMGLVFYLREYGTADILQILTFSKWMIFSEFIASFAAVLLLNAIFHKPLQLVIESPVWTVLLSTAFFLTTFIPSDQISNPRWALLIGVPGSLVSSFPVLPFFPLYLIGMYVARHKIRATLPLALAAMLWVAIYYVYRSNYGLPTRFPPSFAWMIGTVGFVFLWYAFASLIDRWKLARQLLVPVGANALFYLLVCNFFLFAIRTKLSLKASIEYTLLIMAVAYFLTTITRQIKLTEAAKSPAREPDLDESIQGTTRS